MQIRYFSKVPYLPFFDFGSSKELCPHSTVPYLEFRLYIWYVFSSLNWAASLTLNILGKPLTRDATTQVKPRQRNASVACSINKSSSPMKSLIKSVKKNVDPDQIRKSSKSVISSASSKLEMMAPATPKRLRSIGKGTKKAFKEFKNKMEQ